MSNNELSALQAEELLATVMEQLAEELLAAKQHGKPLSENLPVIDRLLKYEALRQRRAALRLRERKLNEAAVAARKKETPPAPPKRIWTQEETVAHINAIRRKMWGFLPEEYEAEQKAKQEQLKNATTPPVATVPEAPEAPAPTVLPADPALYDDGTPIGSGPKAVQSYSNPVTVQWEKPDYHAMRRRARDFGL